MRSLITCPVCQSEYGVTFNLAEYLDNGVLSIRTTYNNYKGENIPMFIAGKEFELICGQCKQIAFRKQPVLIQQTTTLTFGTI